MGPGAQRPLLHQPPEQDQHDVQQLRANHPRYPRATRPSQLVHRTFQAQPAQPQDDYKKEQEQVPYPRSFRSEDKSDRRFETFVVLSISHLFRLRTDYPNHCDILQDIFFYALWYASCFFQPSSKSNGHRTAASSAERASRALQRLVGRKCGPT